LFFVGSAFLFAHSTVTYHWEKQAPSWLQPVVKSLPFWAVKVHESAASVAAQMPCAIGGAQRLLRFAGRAKCRACKK
jgi:hypothetical protein